MCKAGLAHAIVAALVLLGVAVVPLSSSAQVVGGQPINIREAPWQVALRIQTGGQYTLCGGAVIDPDWVLTAAHCLPVGVDPKDVNVITGTSDYLNGGRWIAVRDVVLNDAYDPVTNDADLALLRVAVPIAGVAIRWSQSAAELRTGEPLFVTGWGATAEGGQKSRQLMRAVVPYVDNRTCNQPQSYAGKVLPSMLCAGEAFGGLDACQGDSGGPLVQAGDDGPVLVGVISFGVGCGRKLKYGVYARVGAYRDWIEGTLRSN
jgi:secreted trypsin-like serine protease